MLKAGRNVGDVLQQFGGDRISPQHRGSWVVSLTGSGIVATPSRIAFIESIGIINNGLRVDEFADRVVSAIILNRHIYFCMYVCVCVLGFASLFSLDLCLEFVLVEKGGNGLF